ncbi:MAG: GTPase Era, partial [Bacteroidota bacterium]
VFSDTPGIIKDPTYRMQEMMNSYVKTTFEDADIMLFVTEPGEKYADDDPVIERLRKIEVPLFLVLNKIDLVEEGQVLEIIKMWNERISFSESIPISALHKSNTERLMQLLLDNIPEGPVYYPKDQLTDKPERFFVSEIIREKILLLYKQEVPYSCDVAVESFKETKTKAGEDLVRISAIIFVSRRTQKPIIIGKNGSAIKRLGTEARKSIETFLEKKVFLELHVKIKENWRDDERTLRHLGY